MLKAFIYSFLLVLLVGFGWAADFRSSSLGTQTIGVRYKFTDECALVETSKAIQALGSDTLKIALTPKYTDDYMMKPDPQIDSVMDLIREKPSYLQVLDMPFRNIILWLYPFSDQQSYYLGTIPEGEAEAMYREIYNFTAYLLNRYSGSGKTFYIGNWEGDWHLLKEVYDYDLDPDPKAIKGMIEWLKLRQKAVSDALRDVKHFDVKVYFYVELNHVRKALKEGRPALVNTVLPYIKADFVSWSSYDITLPAVKMELQEGRELVFDALDYIEQHLPESEVKGKRVFIGEYGYNLQFSKSRLNQLAYTAMIAKWGLEWGCPFILHWEMYCNEIDSKTGKHRGYWLIDDQGDKQPIWYLHREFLDKADAFIAEFEDENGRLPTQVEYNGAAVAWFEELLTYGLVN